MGTPQDASVLNDQTLTANYFYTVSTSGVSSSGFNGTNTYSSQVNGYGSSSVSGMITDTSSNENGSFSVTASNGTVTNYLVLGSSADTQNLVIQPYNPSTGTPTGGYLVLADSGTQSTSAISFNSSNGYL